MGELAQMVAAEQCGRESFFEYVPPSALLEPEWQHAELESAPDIIEAVGLKTSGRGLCNLGCTYCYEDFSPKVMQYDTVRQVARDIVAYGGVSQVIIHGGEPLVTHPVDPPERYYPNLMGILREELGECMPTVHMQSNCTLMTPAIAEMLKREGIKVSGSLDGGPEANSRRVNLAGKPSYEATVRGIRTLHDVYPEGLLGIIGVINPEADPVAAYKALCSLPLQGKNIDFSLPYDTYATTPRPDSERYTQWLLSVYEAWMRDRLAKTDPPDIRFFSSIRNLDRGGRSRTASLGLLHDNVVFVRPDGTYEGPDALTLIERVTLPSAGANPLKEAEDEMRRRNLLGRKPLPDACRPCSVRDICGGGHMANQYSPERGFDNPSVFCGTLRSVIERVVTDSHGMRNFVNFHRIVRADCVPPKLPLPAQEGPVLIGALSSHIRPATLDDLEALVRVQKSDFIDSYAHRWPGTAEAFDAFMQEFGERKRAYWADLLQSGRASNETVRVALLGGQVIAFAWLSQLAGRDSELGALFCSPDITRHYKRPVAKTLLYEMAHVAFGGASSGRIATAEVPDTDRLDTLRRFHFVNQPSPRRQLPATPLPLVSLELQAA